MSVSQLRSLYQIKITLVGAKPPIWRRLVVHDTITLDVLHTAIQYSMGWTDSHMHQFEKNRVFYGIDDDDFGFDIENERKFSLKDLGAALL